jgi:hypothetical protein
MPPEIDNVALFGGRAVVSRKVVGALVLSCVAGCGGAAPEGSAPRAGESTTRTGATAAATVVAPVAATASARPAADEVWSKAPIKTAVQGAEGCTLTGGAGMLALSVDGEASGVFVERMGGARGEIVIVPGGKSAARVRFGAAFFDTGLWLAGTVFRLKERPPPLGGVVRPREDVSFRVVGGDKTRLSVEMTGYGTGDLEWAAPPKLEVPCQGLKFGRWAPEAPLPATKGRLYPAGEAKVGFRADKNGPVVVRVRVSGAELLETAGDLVKVVSWITVGTAVGWTEKKEWTETPPPPAGPFPIGSLAGQGGGGSGMGFLNAPKVVCPFGTPLYVRRADQLYEVGELRAPPADAPKEEIDWRVHEGKFELDRGVPRPPEAAPWIALRDDFRITNRLWHGGVAGTFVVPKFVEEKVEKGCW